MEKKKQVRDNNPNKKITEEIRQFILEAALEDRITYKIISNRVKEKFNIDYSAPSISYLLKAAKQERSIYSKALIRDNIAKHIMSDLDMLVQKKNELFQLAARQLLADDMNNYYKSVDRLKDYAKMSFDLSGVNETTTDALALQAREDLLEELEKTTNGQYKGQFKPKTAITEYQDQNKEEIISDPFPMTFSSIKDDETN